MAKIKLTLKERCLAKVVPLTESGCWIWMGALNVGGYAQVQVSKPKRGIKSAHRIMFELFRGPIPKGLDLDHLCRVRCCVNPDHLEPVTEAENVRRGINFNSLKRYCPSGHPYDQDNIYRNPTTGERRCRACGMLASQKRLVARQHLSVLQVEHSNI